MAPIHIGTSDVKINYGVQTAAPTSPSPTEGSEYWHKTKNKKYIYDGTIWNSVTTSAPYSGGTATHWWTQAGLSDNDGWTAEKGSKDLTRYNDDELIYTASDSDFNNKKTIATHASTATDAYLATSSSGSNGDLLNFRNEAFSIMIVTKKHAHNHSFGMGDALFSVLEGYATSGSNSHHWSMEPSGDHIWHEGGQHWADDQAGNIPGGVPCTGIFLAKFDSSGDGGIYWWNKGSSTSSWTTLGTCSGWTTNGPGSNGSPGFSFFGVGAYSNHGYHGKLADIIYWKGTEISNTERDAYKAWAVEEYGLDS